MKTFVQYLKRNENNGVEPITGKNDITILDERKTLNSHIVEAFELIKNHPQTNIIVGFNIIAEDSFQNRQMILNQNIFDY